MVEDVLAQLVAFPSVGGTPDGPIADECRAMILALGERLCA